jgi:hypothetical protein
MDDVDSVAEHLDLDVASPLDQPLEIKAAVAEGGPRLGARLREKALELGRVPRDANAASPSPGPPP